MAGHRSPIPCGTVMRNNSWRQDAPVIVPPSRLILERDPTPETLTERDTAPDQLANPAA
jgi:hypothetical protein